MISSSHIRQWQKRADVIVDRVSGSYRRFVCGKYLKLICIFLYNSIKKKMKKKKKKEKNTQNWIDIAIRR